MDKDAFRTWSIRAAEWGADYRDGLRDRPVRAPGRPGDVARRIPASPPETPEPMDAIFTDFEQVIVPGMTHWQHPRFFAYFPANAAPVSVVAEYLVTAIGAQCMLWQTSPAATELETVALDWLRQALGLADGFSGVIQDSASSATLAAVLTMRERALKWHGNRDGLAAHPAVRIYSSDQVHTSIDRAIWIAGIGESNLVRVRTTGPTRGMDPAELDAAIRRDREGGLLPAGIIANVGGTSIGACDDVTAICAVAKAHDLYVHADAAWAGSAMICPEFRHFWSGIDEVDSVVLNPHKWLGAQFDCTAHYLRDPDSLRRTLAIHPEFLKTPGREGMVDYSEWSIPLGRRFRALKLWFLMRAHGLDGLRGMIRDHVAWAETLAARLSAEPDFEITSAPFLSLFSFRYAPAGVDNLDALNQQLLDRINDDGRIYLTQTRVDGRFVIRFQVGSFAAQGSDVDFAFDVIRELAHGLNR